MDAYLGEHHATCNRRTWSTDVYIAYIRCLFEPRQESAAAAALRLKAASRRLASTTTATATGTTARA